MKQILLKSPLLVFIFAVLYGCIGNSGKVNSDSSKTDSVKKVTATLAPIGVTLNGVAYGEAKVMITNFRIDSSSSNPRSSIWLSRKWVEKVYPIIKNEGGDGFRIYFAKTSDKKNSLVIVATKYSGSDTTAPSKKIHQDFLVHPDSFLATNDAKFISEFKLTPQESKLYFSNNGCRGDECDLTEENHQLSCKDAFRYVDYFYNSGKPININTHSEWIDTVILVKLIKEYKEYDKVNSPKKADGIRLYYGKVNDKKEKDYDRNNLIFVTTASINNLHQDYFECNDKDDVKPNNIRHNSANLTNSRSNTAPVLINIQSTSDKNEKCPNNCTGASLFN